MARREIPRNTPGKRELSLVGNHPRIPKMSFHNGSLRRLLFQILRILQHPPCPQKNKITSGAPLAIMVMVHGAFTVRIVTMSGKISKARNYMFVFTIPLPMQ